MNELDPIRDYLLDLARQMPGRSVRERRVLEEIKVHLHESVDSLVRQGIDPVEAAQRAVEHLALRRRLSGDSISKHLSKMRWRK